MDPHDAPRTRLLWESAIKRGIPLHQFQIRNNPGGLSFFVARLGSRARAFEGLPRPNRGISKSITWMDNKAILKKKFTAAGIPMAKGRACRTFPQALTILKELGGPLITKPHIGSRSRHSSVHIRTEEQLRHGFDIAKQLSPLVIVEQELQGYLFRILLVNEKVAGVIRREPPFVLGDGIVTIRELIEAENKNPKRQGPTFHMLRMDEDVKKELERQNRSLDSIPKKDEIIFLSTHISRFYGGSTSNVTNRVHPDNIKLFEHIGETLGDSLVGVDFIIGDMELSWKVQSLCGVIECNSLPNIDLHHDVLYGENFDAAGYLLDLVL